MSVSDDQADSRAGQQHDGSSGSKPAFGKSLLLKQAALLSAAVVLAAGALGWAGHVAVAAGHGAVAVGLLLIGIPGSFLLARRVTRLAEQLADSYGLLERRVEKRTSELSQMNTLLTREIAIRKRVEQALRDSEAVYSSLVENVPVCVIRKDLEGKFTFANKSFCELVHQALEQLVGKTDFDLYPDRLAKKYRRDDQTVVETGKLLTAVEENQKNGETQYVEVLKTPVHDSQGRVVGTQAIFWDVTDAKRAEQALHESAVRRRAIFEAALDCMIVTDAEGRILEFNRAGETTFGYSSAEVIGREMDKLLFEPSSAERYRNYLECYPAMPEEGSLPGHRLDVNMVRKNGEQFVAEMAMQPVPLEGEQVFTVFLRDITERKQAEAALDREQYLLHALMDNLPDCIYFKDESSRFLRISTALADRLGLSDPAEAAGKTDGNFFPAEYARQAHADEQSLMRTGWALVGKEEHPTWPDGQEGWVSTTKVPLRDKAGKIVGTFGISRDITEQKRAAEAVRESEHRTRLIVDTALDAFVAIDADGLIVDWNAQAAVTFGWSRKEVLGRNLAETIIPLQHREAHNNGLAQFRTTGRGPLLNKRIEITALHRDGHEFPVEMTISPIRLQQTYIFGAFVHDITERQRRQTELQKAKEVAEAANRAKSDFLANMSHEIRTPMNAVIGMTELVLHTELTASQREYLRMVLESGESLLEVINEVLDFSKIEAGKLSLERKPMALRDSLGDTMKLLALRAHREDLELACHIAPEVPDALMGDAGRLRQIVVNLVGNAIKFTETGEVVLDVARQSQSADAVVLHFSVSDTGIGIPQEKLATIFDAFEQADTSTTREFAGTGLGLAITSKLVEMMDGQTSVESQLGRGSTFHFTARFELAQDEADERHAVSTARIRGTRVLVVDDNATNRRILDELLGHWEMIPISVSGADDALCELRKAQRAGETIPLVVTDVNMPNTDGFTLVAQIKQDKELGSTIIMMLSSGARPGDIARCEELGVAAYLMKPIKQSELFDAIVLALEITDVEDDTPELTAAEAPPQLRPLRILLAEDSPANQKLAVGLLENWGHTVSVAHNGREAVAAMESQRFNLVLMDVQMPEMDGLEATAVIRQRERQTGEHVPIIAMTAHAMKGDRERCLEAGMDEYVAKPIRAKGLRDTIERVVEHPGQSMPQPDAAAGETQLDWSVALRAVQGDRKLLKDVVKAFLAESTVLLSDLRAAFQDADAPTVRRTAHTLKGAMRTFGAGLAAQRARRVEEIAAQGDLQEAGDALVALQENLHEVVRELSAFAAAKNDEDDSK